MNIETITGLLGFTMWLTPMILVNCMAIYRIAEFIEAKIPEKYREWIVYAVSWLWVIVGMALMAVSV